MSLNPDCSRAVPVADAHRVRGYAGTGEQLGANAARHPLGPLGPGLDMYTAGEQIRAAKGR